MTRPLVSRWVPALAVAVSLVTSAGIAAAVAGTGPAHPRAAIVPPGQQYTCVGTQDPNGHDHWLACVWY